MITEGLVIRENNNIGESDRFITVLTKDFGIIRASVRGARNIQNKSASATQLLSYSRLSLYKGRSKYIVNDAKPITIFFDIRTDIIKLTLAQFFCEVTAVLAPEEENAEDYLRLALNSLSFLSTGKFPAEQVKAVFELRMLSMSGFQPNLIGCSSCDVYDDDKFRFFPAEGILVCSKCHAEYKNGGILISKSTLAAMRHIVLSTFEKCFFFSMLSDETLRELSKISEIFLLSQLNRSFNTLDFYHTMFSS